jgi:hypothetical protein
LKILNRATRRAVRSDPTAHPTRHRVRAPHPRTECSSATCTCGERGSVGSRLCAARARHTLRVQTHDVQGCAIGPHPPPLYGTAALLAFPDRHVLHAARVTTHTLYTCDAPVSTVRCTSHVTHCTQGGLGGPTKLNEQPRPPCLGALLARFVSLRYCTDVTAHMTLTMSTVRSDRVATRVTRSSIDGHGHQAKASFINPPRPHQSPTVFPPIYRSLMQARGRPCLGR